MAKEIRAIVDVGTNSTRLLVAEVSGGSVEPIFEASEFTQLGQGLFQSRRLSPAAIARVAQAVESFSHQAAGFNPALTRVIATSAAREAANADELIDAIRERTGLRAEILGGEQEAHWVFRGATTDTDLPRFPLMVFDIGGGSTEIVIGDDLVIAGRHSFPIGTLRLLDLVQAADPPTAGDLARCRSCLDTLFQSEEASGIDRIRRSFGVHGIRLVGASGTVVRLAKLASMRAAAPVEKATAQRLGLREARSLVEWLWNLSRSQRCQIEWLPSERADLVLTAAALVEAIMSRFGFDDLVVSTRGLRYGALLDARCFQILATRIVEDPTDRGRAVDSSAMELPSIGKSIEGLLQPSAG